THLVLSGSEFSLEDFQDVKRGPGSPVLGCLLQFGDDNGFTPGDDVLEGGMLCFCPNRRHPQREKAEKKHGLEGTTHQRILPNQKRPKRRRKAPRLPLSKGKKRTRTFFGIKPQKKCRSPFPAHLRAFWGFLAQALASFVRTLLDLVLRPSRISLRDCSPQGHSPGTMRSPRASSFGNARFAACKRARGWPRWIPCSRKSRWAGPSLSRCASSQAH